MKKAIPAIAFLLYGASALTLEDTSNQRLATIQSKLRAQAFEDEEGDTGE